jgi:hypothetical protein
MAGIIIVKTKISISFIFFTPFISSKYFMVRSLAAEAEAENIT